MQQAALKEGEAAIKRAELAEAEANVDAIDEIEATGKRAIDAYGQRAAITRGEHPAIRSATEVIERALRDKDLKDACRRSANIQRRRRCRRASSRAARDGRATALAAIEQAKADQQTYRRQMADVESIRRDYRRRGYNRGMFDTAGGR